MISNNEPIIALCFLIYEKSQPHVSNMCIKKTLFSDDLGRVNEDELLTTLLLFFKTPQISTTDGDYTKWRNFIRIS